MKRIFKWLIPGFLQRLDGYLLENQPVIWRTRIHFVLFYAFVATIILFTIGFFYSNPHTEPIVDPIKPIEITNEIYYLIPLAICVIGILNWAYLLYEFPLQNSVSSKLLLTLLIYAIGLCVTISFIPSSFRLGTIIKTAYYWIDDDDIKYLRKNDFFLYGFILLEEDFTYQEQSDSFFKRREMIFKNIYRKEDTLLLNRYDLPFLYKYGIFSLDSLNESSLLSRSYFNFANKSDNETISNNLFSMYEFYRSSYPNIYLIEESLFWDAVNHIDDNHNEKALDSIFFSKDIVFSYLSDYSVYYHKNILPSLNKYILTKYNIQESYDTTLYRGNNVVSVFPKHIYQLENLVRKVEHARLYLREKIIWNSLSDFFLFAIPFVCLLFAAMNYLSIDLSIWAIFIGLIIAVFGTLILEGIINNKYLLNGLSYLVLPFLSMFCLILLTFLHKLNKLNRLAIYIFHLLIVGVGFICLLSFFGGDDNNIIYTGIEKPVNLAFFGAQVIGLAGLLLMAYLQAQPKSS